MIHLKGGVPINHNLAYRPIAALIGGVSAPPRRIMGHAGAFELPGELLEDLTLEFVGLVVAFGLGRDGQDLGELGR